jgi:putative tryptophan/tyrosine transport system substrate-binding protein
VRRREFVAGLAFSPALPVATHAQRPAVVGLLHVSPDHRAPGVSAVLEGMGEIGLVEGRDFIVEFRGAGNEAGRLPALANELVHHGVSIIGALGGSGPALAAKMATKAIPIVFAAPSNPVQLGIVASLNRPGANITGVAGFTDELAAKRLSMLREVVPLTSTVAVLVNPSASEPAIGLLDRALSNAAGLLNTQLVYVRTNNERDLEAAFAEAKQRRADAMLADTTGLLMYWRQQIVSLAADYRLPALYARREFADDGGLMSYGADFNELYRQAGRYIGRILKGESPANLPVLQPTKFELVINLKTAAALGLTIPETLLATANDVIQ